MCGVEPHNTIINALTQLFPPVYVGLNPSCPITSMEILFPIFFFAIIHLYHKA